MGEFGLSRLEEEEEKLRVRMVGLYEQLGPPPPSSSSSPFSLFSFLSSQRDGSSSFDRLVGSSFLEEREEERERLYEEYLGERGIQKEDLPRTSWVWGWRELVSLCVRAGSVEVCFFDSLKVNGEKVALWCGWEGEGSREEGSQTLGACRRWQYEEERRREGLGDAELIQYEGGGEKKALRERGGREELTGFFFPLKTELGGRMLSVSFHCDDNLRAEGDLSSSIKVYTPLLCDVYELNVKVASQLEA